MPARQRGWVRKRKGGWQACYREESRIRVGPHLFQTKTEAKDWLGDNLSAGRQLRGRDVMFTDHVDRFLRIHAANVEPRTITTLRHRLGATDPELAESPRSKPKGRSYKTPVEQFGYVTLADLEQMADAIAEWKATLPDAYRYSVMSAMRQALNAAVRWNLILRNPAIAAGPNPQPKVEEVPFFMSLADVDRLAVELGHARPKRKVEHVYGPIAVFGVETGLRPEEWIALQRRDIDRRARVVRVRRSYVDGVLNEYGKTHRSRRDVPLTARAEAALDELAPRVDTSLLFPAPKGGHLNLGNWRRREWTPAIEAAGLDSLLTPYCMRHTYASFALAAGVSIFELARVMGTSVAVIDRTYGHLVHDSHDRVRQALERRARLEAEQMRTRSGTV